MKQVLICLLLLLAVPAWPSDKKPLKTQKQKQQTESVLEEKLCINGIERMELLLNLNPYDNKNRCFSFTGKNVQLLDRSHAFFSFFTSYEPFALVDFGKNSAPMGFDKMVVNGNGAFAYKTTSGEMKTVHSFKVVSESMLEELRVKKESEELKRLGPEGIKKRDDERKQLEAERRQIEEERALKIIEENKLKQDINEKADAERRAKDAVKRKQKEEELKKCLDEGMDLC